MRICWHVAIWLLIWTSCSTSSFWETWVIFLSSDFFYVKLIPSVVWGICSKGHSQRGGPEWLRAGPGISVGWKVKKTLQIRQYIVMHFNYIIVCCNFSGSYIINPDWNKIYYCAQPGWRRLEPVCCKKRPIKVPTKKLVWEIGDIWRFWMIPNWS